MYYYILRARNTGTVHVSECKSGEATFCAAVAVIKDMSLLVCN